MGDGAVIIPETMAADKTTDGKRSGRRRGRGLGMSAALAPAAALAILALLILEGALSPAYVLHRGLLPLARLLTIMALSLWLSALIEGMGWSEVLARVTRPLMGFAGFGEWTAAAFVTAFVSGIAANTMIWNAYKEGRMEWTEMVLAVFLNIGLPSYVLHLPTTLAIIVPLAGTAGAIYMAITFGAAIIRTVAVVAAARLLLRPERGGRPQDPTAREGKGSGGRWERVKALYKRYLTVRLARIASYTIPIYLGVMLLQHYHFFQWLQEFSLRFFPSSTLPVEGMSVVIFSIVAEFAAGAAAAGAMLNGGVLSVDQTVLALVLGNVVATPFRAIRHQLPRYLGIFQFRTGMALLLGGQLMRVASVAASAWLYFTLFGGKL